MQTVHWRKSTYSGDGSNCVEVATAPTAIHIRDSKYPAARQVSLSPTAWATFLVYVSGSTPRHPLN
ncbi:DUF397 domain-containing protein [Streptomyces poonensis]|uniref:DUF397 domain-containing protein n=1 Tax=Streptomyces poonensis TaxID=68255 RepID=A0A918UTX3_9ACTN|nr:DUF397 domain-containing protein [Streptomyces poonensis]GGZ33922.1 hypothetical protein GCM10010365_63480 [Streptomyces poonensis]GLJ89231.1 hypothetical protein GCM10017589_18310 [Streptomyces poonensis]